MKETRASFFKQSGWMVIATVAGGVFMTLVHILATSETLMKPAAMQPTEYSVFATLLKVYLLIGIPAGGLQTVFAQQTAAAQKDEERRQLAQTTQSVLQMTFGIWLVCGLAVFFLSNPICEAMKINQPLALLYTVLLGLASLWMPIFKGLLQGVQNFGGLGAVFILDGMIRFGAAVLLVFILKYQSAGGMAAALIGNVVAVGVGAWLTRQIWLGAVSRFNWKIWLSKVVPLTAGTGCVLIMSVTDAIFIQSIFPSTVTFLYMAASMVGFAINQFTMPLSMVMFPKIARSVAGSQETNALKMTLEGILALGGLASLICTLFPTLPLRIIYLGNPHYLNAAPLVQWICWCLLFMSLANALISNLLAREKYGFVLFLMLITAAYLLTLICLRKQLVMMGPFPAFKTVIQILSIYNVVLFGVASWYNWRLAYQKPAS